MNRLSTSRVRTALKLRVRRALSMETLERRFAMDGANASSYLAEVGDKSGNASADLVGQPARTSARLAFRIEVTDLEEQPLTDIQVEKEFYLKIYVEDLRELPRNSLSIFSAYVNIAIDWNRFALTSKPRLGRDFWDDDILWTTDQPSKYPELLETMGGVLIQRREFGTPFLLALIPLRATAPGDSKISLHPVDNRLGVSRETAFYGDDTQLLATAIHFDSMSLSILPKGSTSNGGDGVPAIPTEVPNGSLAPLLPSNTSSPIVNIPSTVIPIAPVAPVSSPIVEVPVVKASVIEVPSISLPLEMTPTKPAFSSSQEVRGENLVSKTFAMKTLEMENVLIASWEPETNEVDWLLDRIDMKASDLGSHPRLITPMEGLEWLELFSLPIDGFPWRRKEGASPLTAGDLRVRTRDEDWTNENQLKGVANDVISRILERIELNHFLNEGERHFEWEAVYTCRSLQRIPFERCVGEAERSGVSASRHDGYRDIDLPWQAAFARRFGPNGSMRHGLMPTEPETRSRLAFPFVFEGRSLQRLAFNGSEANRVDDASWTLAGEKRVTADEVVVEKAKTKGVSLGGGEPALEEAMEASDVSSSYYRHWENWFLSGVACLGWLLLHGREKEEPSGNARSTGWATRYSYFPRSRDKRTNSMRKEWGK